ncbi:MAG TPA: FHA domain-containing protein [Gemmataceae bacterium]|nr:FHA domain-containing protein [Gemmataceae bacterium]
MLGFAWLTLRQAQEALKNGRLEEAQRLLGQPAAQGHRRFWELAEQVARAFVERGERHLRQDNPEGAWHDLLQAEQLGAASTAGRLRQTLVRIGLDEVRALVNMGEPSRALEAIARLRERSVQHPELQRLEDGARAWQTARDHGNRGEFCLALEMVERLRRLLPEAADPLDQFRHDLEQRQRTFAGLLVKLHEAADRARWQEVVELSEQVLAAAPNHAEARRARTLAWKAIEPITVPVRGAAVRYDRLPAEPAEPPQRFLLWIDGVGGYLVCMGSRVTLGQATTDATVDIPLFADVSRLHATLIRDPEGYCLEAARPVTVNGKPIDKVLLRPNDRITLGSACQLQFVQPAAISISARLDLVSKHRLPLAVDAVLLMADTLLLGPGPQMHVTVPELKQPVVLYRNKDRLAVRYPGNLIIDGQRCSERGQLGPNSSVVADDFAFAIEPVGTRMGRT